MYKERENGALRIGVKTRGKAITYFKDLQVDGGGKKKPPCEYRKTSVEV